ncbi:MAG: PqqD family peptide modification chaperone [Pseudomonadota bacterium]
MAIRKITDKRLTRELGGELIVYDQDNHKVFHLNQSAAAAWDACDDCANLHDLSLKIADHTKEPANDDAAQLALMELREAGLIEGDYEVGVNAMLTRRELINSIGQLAITLPVVMAMFAPTAAMAQSAEPTPQPEPEPSD